MDYHKQNHYDSKAERLEERNNSCLATEDIVSPKGVFQHDSNLHIYTNLKNPTEKKNVGISEKNKQ